MKEAKLKKSSLSIKYTIMLLFVLLMFTTVGVIGYLVFSNWWISTEESVEKLAENTNTEIFNKVEAFIDIPMYINEINHGLIENNIVDIKNEIERESFFVGVLDTQTVGAVYSFSYGTETGEYYGARRNEANEIEIMKNNEDTGGNSWYYSVTDELTAGELVTEAGKFDPRTRDWYKTAKEKGESIFSPIYKHFVMDDLAISAATPIYNEDKELVGVLGTHITLSRIDNYLKEIVKETKAFAVIVEKDSGELISNSFDMENFEIIADGSMKRVKIDESDNPIIIQTLDKYKTTLESNYEVKNLNGSIHVNITEFQKAGLDWLVIVGIPENSFMASIFTNIKLTILMTVIALFVSIIIYLGIINKLLMPIKRLMDTTEKFAKGDLSQRTAIVKKNEIGSLSNAFNKMADTIYELVNNLEAEVKTRTLELEDTNNLLKDNKDQLSLILDSTAEAIYGIDNKGNCTFCNASFLKILGYSHQDELIGKSMHDLIHHSREDNTILPIEECKMHIALIEAKGTHVDDEMFWKADGTNINVEYNSYPQFKDGVKIGAVVTFMDNSDRKNKEKHIKYLSYHDSLTGLYNRMYFEDAIKSMDINENLPISIIYCDVNGLKLTNDIFGHTAGDDLLKKSAEILKNASREEDVVARVGGDEFAVLLKKTDESRTVKIIERVKEQLLKEKIIAIKCSMSMGNGTKTNINQDINVILKRAEDKMYKMKTLNRKNVNSDMIHTIVETLHTKSPREKSHSMAVSEMCQHIGRKMNLAETENKKLAKLGLLHDIGKIILDEAILNKQGDLTDEEKSTLQQHTVIGYRILNLFEDTLDLSESVLAHHERWDGLGYPKGLIGEEIPKLSRILAVAEGYESLTDTSKYIAMSKLEAVEEIKKQSGVRYDPEIVKAFLEIMG